MGYKVWRGGKSAWVSTASFGTEHEKSEPGGGGDVVKHESGKEYRWRVPLKVGGYKTVNASSAKAARAMLKDEADPRRSVLRDKSSY